MSFVESIAINLVASVLYDSGKGLPADLAKLIAGDLQQGKLPANHDLYKLAHRSLRSALCFAHASCANDIGEKLPFFPAIMQAWTEKRLFDQPLKDVRETPQHDWLDRFGKAIRDDAAFNAFDGTGTGLDEVDAASLTATQFDTNTQSLLNTRLNEWVTRHVESPSPAVSRPRFFKDGLKLGFPIDGDAQRRLTVYAAWCLFFREGLKDAQDERPFKAYVIAKLDEISQSRGVPFDGEAFATQLNDQLIEKLAQRIPDIEYFDLQFESIEALIKLEALKSQEHMTAEIQRAIDTLTQKINTLAERLGELEGKPSSIPRLPTLQNRFVGRTEEQQKLLDTLRSDDTGTTPAGRVAGIAAGVRGQGGIGKTALALAVAHQIKDDFPAGRVYIDLRGTTDPLSSRNAMESILHQFEPKADFRGADDDQLTAHYRAFLGSQKVLLLLDNAAEAKQVTPLIPGGSCAVIVTSRKQFNLNGVAPLSLDLLSEADAVALAQSLAPRLTDDQARGLAQACGRLALAVRLVATQISLDEGISVADHLDDLRSDRLAYLDTVETDAADSPHGHDSLPFARRAIELSLEGLDNPALRPFWTRLSVFPVDFNHTLVSLVALDGDEPDPRIGHKMLEALRRHALLEFDAENQRYSLHDLAREYAQTRELDEDACTDLSRRHAEVFIQMLSAANQLYLNGKQIEGLARLDSELASIIAGQKWASDYWQADPTACRLAANYFLAGVYLLDLRLSSKTQIAWHNTAVKAFHKIGDHKGEGTALCNLGNAHAALGDVRTAMDFYEQNLTISCEIADRRGEAGALGNLGTAYRNLGDPQKAVNYHNRALAIFTEISDRRGEGVVLGNLGNDHADLGDYQEALEYHKKALRVSHELGDRQGESQHFVNLGNDYADLGDSQIAIEHFTEAFCISQEIGHRWGQGMALYNRSCELFSQEQWCDAADDMERAAAIYAEIEHPKAARAAELAIEYRQKAGD